MSSHTSCNQRAVTSATSPFGFENAPSTCLYRRCRLGDRAVPTSPGTVPGGADSSSPGTSTPGTVIGSHTWSTPFDAHSFFRRRRVTTPTTPTALSELSSALASSFHSASPALLASPEWSPAASILFHSVTTTSPPRLARNPTAESPVATRAFASSASLRRSSRTGMTLAMGSDAHGNTSVSPSSSASSSPSITTSPFSKSAYLSLPSSSRAMANLHRDLYPRVFGDAYTSTPRAGMKPPPWKSSRTLLVLSASSSRYASFVEVSEDGAEVAEATVRGRRDEHLNRVSEGRGHGATRVGRRVARMPRDKKEMPTPMTLPAVDIFRARVAVRVPS